jgi:hypothetical protein
MEKRALEFIACRQSYPRCYLYDPLSIYSSAMTIKPCNDFKRSQRHEDVLDHLASHIRTTEVGPFARSIAARELAVSRLFLPSCVFSCS